MVYIDNCTPKEVSSSPSLLTDLVMKGSCVLFSDFSASSEVMYYGTPLFCDYEIVH